MKNYRLFTLHPYGFDNFGTWIDHHREMHRRHPLDVTEFSAAWLRRWEAAGALLEAPAVRECQFANSKVWFAADRGPVSQMLRQCTMYDLHLGRRCVLLDGTVVKEWGTK